MGLYVNIQPMVHSGGKEVSNNFPHAHMYGTPSRAGRKPTSVHDVHVTAMPPVTRVSLAVPTSVGGECGHAVAGLGSARLALRPHPDLVHRARQEVTQLRQVLGSSQRTPLRPAASAA